MATLGVDLGTSAVKAVVVGADGRIVGEVSAPLALSSPRPLWSEQDPAAWWKAATKAVRGVVKKCVGEEIEAIALSGQMHGAVLLDAKDQVLRPAILWNDGRCEAECRELEEAVPRLVKRTGNRALVGFTAPKLRWVRKHEPAVWRRMRRVLLPKDWLRFRLCGAAAAELSDASGSLLLDVRRRRWDPAMLAACEIEAEQLGPLLEGTEVAGALSSDAARAWGLRSGIPIVGGGGDQACGAVGAGCTEAGQATIALGTSGVVFAVSDGYAPDAKGRVHAFCHALPDRWHVMGVMLSAAGSLQWLKETCFPRVGFDALDSAAEEVEPGCDGLLFLPYLSGERTPHFDAEARGAFLGLTRRHGRGHLVRAVLEGVAFGLADSLSLVREAGTEIERATLTGGGAKSATWRRILADVLDVELVTREGAVAGPALGAARLAAIGATGAPLRRAAKPGPITSRTRPRARTVKRYAEIAHRFREAYPAVRSLH